MLLLLDVFANSGLTPPGELSPSLAALELNGSDMLAADMAKTPNINLLHVFLLLLFFADKGVIKLQVSLQTFYYFLLLSSSRCVNCFDMHGPVSGGGVEGGGAGDSCTVVRAPCLLCAHSCRQHANQHQHYLSCNICLFSFVGNKVTAST